MSHPMILTALLGAGLVSAGCDDGPAAATPDVQAGESDDRGIDAGPADAARDAAPRDTSVTPDGAPDGPPAEADRGADGGVDGGDASPEPDMSPDPCGNGVLDDGEVCDPAVDGAACRSGCAALCGNGAVEGDEVCDEGDGNGDGRGCSVDCAREGVCGDGTLQPVFEECDEGDTNPGDFCDPECRAIEQVDPLGYDAWPEGARVRITGAFDLRGELQVGAGAVITLEGNWPLEGATLTLRGRAGLPVVVRPDEESRCRSFLIGLEGGTLIASHALFERARTAISGRDGRLELSDSVIRDLCSDAATDLRGIWLRDSTSAVIQRVEMHDFEVTVSGSNGFDEDGQDRARDGARGGGVYGVLFNGDGGITIDGLRLRRFVAGRGGDGGAGADFAGGRGGPGGRAVGVFVNHPSRVDDVRVSALTGGDGGDGGAAAGAGAAGGDAIGLSTDAGRGVAGGVSMDRIEVAGLTSGAGGRGGAGRPGAPGDVGEPGGDGGPPGQVRGIVHGDAELRLTNALVHGLRLGVLGRGGDGGQGGAGADGGPGGETVRDLPAPLVGIEISAPMQVEHATVVVDDQPDARPADAPGGLPGAGGSNPGESTPPRTRVTLYGVLATRGHIGPVSNSVVVGDALDAPGWHHTEGLYGSDNELEVDDTLVWGFDRPVFTVLARRIVQEPPLFVDRPGAVFVPAAESPAVGRGTASDVLLDLRGAERPDPPTLGALEPAPAPEGAEE